MKNYNIIFYFDFRHKSVPVSGDTTIRELIQNYKNRIQYNDSDYTDLVFLVNNGTRLDPHSIETVESRFHNFQLIYVVQGHIDIGA